MPVNRDRASRLCAWCATEDRVTIATDRVPDLRDRVCQPHAESFWQRVVATGSALATLRRLRDAPEGPLSLPAAPEGAFVGPGVLSLAEKAHRFDRARASCPECGRSDPDDVEIPTRAECFRCGSLDCPVGNSLHYIADGCPGCGYQGITGIEPVGIEPE